MNKNRWPTSRARKKAEDARIRNDLPFTISRRIREIDRRMEASGTPPRVRVPYFAAKILAAPAK